MFVMLYVIHYFLSPLLVAHGFIPVLLSNLLFMVAASYYHYLNFLGYDVLPFLEKTTFFLYPIGFVIILSPILKTGPQKSGHEVFFPTVSLFDSPPQLLLGRALANRIDELDQKEAHMEFQLISLCSPFDLVERRGVKVLKNFESFHIVRSKLECQGKKYWSYA
ncbi:UNC-50 [Macleaya cordata]|uniref:UNC-50 n=1 Tax=Macleaya cordata TaxID=56857 RepID=A0A200PV03_MACCD|nr:UNC-50 [Macleaya cordata]